MNSNSLAPSPARIRRQDAAFYAAVACGTGAVLTLRRPAVAAGLAVAATASVAASRHWSRKYPAPFPHSQRWVLELAQFAQPSSRLVDALDPKPGEHILEIGPGTGHLALAVAPAIGPDGQLDILDVQAEMLDTVMQRVRKTDLANVVPTTADAAELPYDDATFDAVYCVSVIGEIPDRERAFRQIARVLAPRGRLVVAEHFLDPDYVSLAALTQAGADAGLELEERLGPPRNYVARLRKPG